MKILITLIKKDFILLQRSLTPALLFPIFFALIAAYASEELFMLLMTMILSAYLPSFVIQILTLDENTKWDKYILSLPVKPKTEACARYILLLFLSLFSVFLIFVIGSAVRISGLVSVSDGMLSAACLYALIYGLLMGDAAIPVMYRFGAVNGRYVIMLSAIVPVIVGICAAASKIPSFVYRLSAAHFIAFLFIFIALVTVVSFFFTCSILKRRNLRG